MRATYKAISGSSPPSPKMMSLPYRMLFDCYFCSFSAPCSAYLLVLSTLAMSSSCNFTDTWHLGCATYAVPQSCPPSPAFLRLLILSFLPLVPLHLNPLALFLRPLLSSFLMTFSISTVIHMKAHDFHPVLTNTLSSTNLFFRLLLVHLF